MIVSYSVSDQPILHAQRISRNNNDTNKRIDTHSVIVIFEGEQLQKYIKLDYVIIPVRPCIYPLKFCFGCFRYGYTKAGFKWKSRCKFCDQDSCIDKVSPIMTNQICCHWGRMHRAGSALNISDKKKGCQTLENHFKRIRRLGKYTLKQKLGQLLTNINTIRL